MDFKAKLLAGAHLHNPIRDGRGFFLMTDSSVQGWGAMLMQKADDGGHLLIAHWSRAHKGYSTSAPAYYNECGAILTGFEWSIPIICSCPKALPILTDALSLTWVAKTSGKAGISPWKWVKLQEWPHEVRYLAGPRNGSDCISRAPFLGPHVFATNGIAYMIDSLLKALPGRLRDCKKPWIACGRSADTQRAARQLQSWRSHNNPTGTHSAQKARVDKGKFDLGFSSLGYTRRHR
jgi:hypothetical protein